MFRYVVLSLSLFNLIYCNPLISGYAGKSSVQSSNFWKNTPMDNIVSNLKTECATQKDVISCMKYRILSLFEETLNKDTVKVTDSVQLVKNADDKVTTDSQTQGRGFVDEIESYVTSHDLKVQLPGALSGATLTVSPRNMEQDELTMSLQFPRSESSVGSERGRKHKIRKILVPIMIFILLKAMTLVPLAIGVLGLKAWNALQLSFFSFIISIALAIFQLCKKIAADSSVPAVHAAGPYEYASHYAAARNFLLGPGETITPEASMDAPVIAAEPAQNLAYSAFAESR